MVGHRSKQDVHAGTNCGFLRSVVAPEAGGTEPAQAGEQRAEADAAQRQIGLTGLTAKAFHRGGGLMADAVDRETGDIGAADQPGQQSGPILDAAIVMQQFDCTAVGERSQPLQLAGPAGLSIAQ